MWAREAHQASAVRLMPDWRAAAEALVEDLTARSRKIKTRS